MSHLTLDKLKAFATGNLPAEETCQIESHLQACHPCGELFDQLDLADDVLVGFLRNSPTLIVGADSRPDSRLKSGLTTAPFGVRLRGATSRVQNLGRYEIDRPLGRGGMGVVYLANDTVLRRQVALKIISPQRDLQPDDLRRFRREAESAARLQHANIVQIFDFDEHEGTWFCAFELVTGGTLSDRLEGEVITPVDAATIVATLAEAVDYAHHRKVIHRDLKPANVLFTSNGTPKVADFGLAKLLDEDVMATRDGTLLGSPCYMSPEQAAGNLELVGREADVYALGAVLYETLTGRPPFQEATALATLEKVRSQPPKRPSRFRSDVDVDLETVCMKCLEKSLEHRYRTAADLAADLRRYAAGLPITARRPGIAERAIKFCRRHPVGSAIAGIFAVIVVAFIVTVTVFGARLGDALRDSTQRKGEAQRSRLSFELQRAASLVLTDPEQAATVLDDEENCPEELRDFSWWYLRSLCRRRLESLRSGESVTAIAVAPSGDFFVTGDKSGVLRVYARNATRPRRVADAHRDEITDLLFSRDGSILVSGSKDDTVKLWDSTLSTSFQLEIGADDVNSVALSPDAQQLATAHSDGGVRIWDVERRQLIKRLDGHDQSVFSLSFNSTGRLLASGSRDQTIRLWQATDWEQSPRVLKHGGWVTDITFSPTDSELFASASNDRVVRLWRLDADDPVVEWAGFKGLVSCVAFSADGKLLAAGSYDRSFGVWDVESHAIALERHTHDDGVASIRFEPSGRLLTGLHNGDVTRWSVEPALRPVAIESHQQAVTGLAYLDENHLLTCDYGGLLQVSRIDDGSCVSRWRAEGQRISDLCVRPNSTFACWESGGRIFSCDLKQPTRISPRIIETDAPLLMSQGIAMDAAGSTLLVNDFSGVVATRLADSENLWQWSEEEVVEIAHANFGTVAAVADVGGQIWIGNSRTGQFERFAVVAESIGWLEFSPRDSRLLVGQANGDVAVFDLATGSMVMSLSGHSGSITCASFSPDGKTLATGSSDGVRLWDTVVGVERARLAHKHDVQAIAFGPDSRSLAFGDNNGTVFIWNVGEAITSP